MSRNAQEGAAVQVRLVDYHPNKKRDMTLDQVYKFLREKIQVGDKNHFGVVNFNVNTPDETDAMKQETRVIIELAKPNIACVDTMFSLKGIDHGDKKGSEPDGDHCPLHIGLKACQTMIN